MLYKESISIHALREEGDTAMLRNIDNQLISIHALREEGDRHDGGAENGARDFYPRPPRGGRHNVAGHLDKVN